jgi:ATP-binding cassette, subfamily B, bacterial MsbA
MEAVRYRRVQYPFMEEFGAIVKALIIWFGGKEVIAGSSTPETSFFFMIDLIMV